MYVLRYYALRYEATYRLDLPGKLQDESDRRIPLELKFFANGEIAVWENDECIAFTTFGVTLGPFVQEFDDYRRYVAIVIEGHESKVVTRLVIRYGRFDGRPDAKIAVEVNTEAEIAEYHSGVFMQSEVRHGNPVVPVVNDPHAFHSLWVARAFMGASVVRPSLLTFRTSSPT